jgi:branched-chain amino acid transport system permease protein
MQFKDKRLLALTGLALALLALVPFAVEGYWIRVLTVIFMFGVVAQGLNLMAGYMGYIPFGNAMFYGIGAYSSAIAMQQGLPFLATLFLGGIVSVVISILFGLPVLRLRGHYFAIATIGLSGGLMSLVQNFTDATGGAMGTTLPIIPQPPQVLYANFYWGMLALMVMTTVCMSLLIRSRFGFAVRSIKANEDAANAMGINTTTVKVITWALSAFFTSLAGSIYAYWMSFIAPAEVFDVMIVVNGIVILLVGGLGTIMGPILGAFTFELVSELTWSHFGEFHMASLGAATIVIVFLIPNGLIGKLSRLSARGKNFAGKETTEHGS